MYIKSSPIVVAAFIYVSLRRLELTDLMPWSSGESSCYSIAWNVFQNMGLPLTMLFYLNLKVQVFSAVVSVTKGEGSGYLGSFLQDNYRLDHLQCCI